MEFLSTKMAVFVDEPRKISLPSTKSGVFVDGPHTKNFPPETRREALNISGKNLMYQSVTTPDAVNLLIID